MPAAKTTVNLFGDVVLAVQLSNSKGYAGSPGAGKNDRQCRHCEHFVRIELSKTYYKCGLTRYTSGKATDIKATAPSCQYFSEA